MADVKVEDDGDLAKDQELVLSVSLAGQLDLTTNYEFKDRPTSKPQVEPFNVTDLAKFSVKSRFVYLIVVYPLSFHMIFYNCKQITQKYVLCHVSKMPQMYRLVPILLRSCLEFCVRLSVCFTSSL